MPKSDLHNPRRRSRSPRSRHVVHRRSRSPLSQRRHQPSSNGPESSATIRRDPLPFQAQPLGRSDLETYRPMFELYLDIQKQKVMENMPEQELKGRWKSFVGKWNRGELAEGWYDPATLQRAIASARENEHQETPHNGDISTARGGSDPSSEESEGDEVGPSAPSKSGQRHTKNGMTGPMAPNSQDLIIRRELAQEEADAEREELRHQRRLERQEQKERLNEIAPRAEAGTKERQLEKKREKADSHRAFAASKTEGGGMAEVGERELLGDEEGGIEGYKRQKQEMERKKNERELRKEEILKARAEEREERLRAYRDKEEKTMSGLMALAKARFG